MVTESVRPALRSDSATWAAQVDGWWAGLAEQRGGRALGAELAGGRPGDVQRLRALDALLVAPDACALVGLLDDVLCAVGVATWSTAPDGLRGRVELCYVEPAARGVGVGSALLEGLVAGLVAADCTSVDAWALPGDRAAKNHFERHGFRARLLTMHREVRPDV